MTTSDVAAEPDVFSIRRSLPGSPYMTQAEFASRFGLSPATVRDWEQGRRQPDAAARVLLTVIAHNPAAVDAALRASRSEATCASNS